MSNHIGQVSEDQSVRCSRCGNKTAGTREGDTEYCTTCGNALGPAFTAEANIPSEQAPERWDGLS